MLAIRKITMLRNQAQAPDFTLQDKNGKERTLSELCGDKPLLLFYYRGAFCPTSHKQLTDYADIYSRFKPLGAELVAVSVDDPETSRRLADELKIKFPLLSDTDFKFARDYGVYKSDDTEGPQPHGEPAIFILDVDGKIAYSQIQTGPKGSANPAELALVLLYMRDNGGKY